MNMTLLNNSPAQKNIVILGGSYGGISTAHYLLKHAIPQLPEPQCYRAIIISTSSQALCRQACPRAMISDGLLPQEKLFVNIPKQFEHYPKNNFHFIQGTARQIDHTNRVIIYELPGGEKEQLDFHALIAATGASTPSPLLSLNHDSNSLRASWAEFRNGLQSAKSIIISGGGPAGVETVGELGEYLNGRASWFTSQHPHPKVNITLITSHSQILPDLRPALAVKAEGYLAKVGVSVVKNTRVLGVTPLGVGTQSVAGKATVTLQGGKTMDADLYIPATGTLPNTNFLDKSLLAADSRIDTNPLTLRVDKAGPRIYAVGDCASYSRPAAHLILEAIPVLCANIKKDLLLAARGDEKHVIEDRVFKEDLSESQLVPIGQSKGVGAMKGYVVPSWLVWLVKGRDYWLWTTGGLWSGKQWAKEK